MQYQNFKTFNLTKETKQSLITSMTSRIQILALNRAQETMKPDLRRAKKMFTNSREILNFGNLFKKERQVYISKLQLWAVPSN